MYREVCDLLMVDINWVFWKLFQENTSSIPESVKNEADHPDWFKDALKRAQEKAKQLSSGQAGKLLLFKLFFYAV